MFNIETAWSFLRQTIDLNTIDLSQIPGLSASSPDSISQPEEKFYIFVNLVTNEAYRSKLLKYPPAPLEVGAYSDRDLDYVIGSGFTNALTIANAINTYLGPTASDLKILDFGCGTGRLSRYLVQFSPENQYYGCEVNPQAVEFLRGNLPGTWDGISPAPPAPYADNSFDVVYAWSIFTHYSEPLHRAWLDEISRILKPGGLLLATVHAAELLYGENRDQLNMPEGIEAKFNQDHYCYWPFYQSRTNKEEFGITDDFGMAFFSHSYIKTHWSPQYQLLSIEPAVPGWQELVVLQK